MKEIQPPIAFSLSPEMEIKNRIMTINFDCLVRMYDYGQREVQGGFFSEPKALPPQWFKLELKLTLETVAMTDPCEIGQAIKDGYGKLKAYIEAYERQGGNI